MAALILEVVARHGSQFHPLDKPVIRIGRALDNDIILTDPAISPHHLVIRRTPEDRYELISIADENGIRIGRQRVDEAIRLDELPLEFDAGRTRFRILDRAQPVAPTRLISCRHGGACIFGHWGWATALFILLTLISAYDNYLSTHRIPSWESYWSDQLVITGTALMLSVGLLVVNRLISHRWDYPASLSFVSLVLIGAFFLDQVASFANYLFTSELPGFLINLSWLALLLPAATAWFLIRLNHGNHVTSWIVIVLLFTPFAYLQFKQVDAHYNLIDEFSKKTYYSNSLYPWDYRLATSIEIEEFMSSGILTEPHTSTSAEREH